MMAEAPPRTAYTAEEWGARYVNADTPWDLGRPHPWLARVFGEIPLAGQRVLTPGAGPGHDAAWLRRHGAVVTAVDITPQALARHRQHYGPQAVTDYRVADFLTLAPAPGEAPWDMLVEHTCFCALHPAQRRDYPRAAHRLIKPGGLLVMVVMLGEEPATPAPHPPHPIGWQALRELFNPFFTLQKHGPLTGPDTPREGREGFALWRR